MTLLLWILVVAGGLVLLGAMLRKGEAGGTAHDESHPAAPAPRRRSGGGCH